MSKLNVRQILALVAASLLVVVLATAGIVAYAVHKTPRQDPTLSAYAYGKSVTVEPFGYCWIDTRECNRTEAVSTLAVPSGYPVQLSLNNDVVDSPWLVLQRYVRPSGEIVDRWLSWLDHPDKRALTIPTQPEPGLRLERLEVQLPVLVRQDGQDTFPARAVWAIVTPEPAPREP